MKPSYHHEYPILDVDPLAAKEIEEVLGKSVSSFRQTKVWHNRSIFCRKNKGNEYSEFHFDAGESSIIRIISEIETLPNSSLVLIEEIENGLHPVFNRSSRRTVMTLSIHYHRKQFGLLSTDRSNKVNYLWRR
jgi:hypothetical protein